ncbi:uncharacterized protein EV154DRAFT_603040 [Mucor mucedo]|uniref:uncharacterized protein n=1 Tax=Mucor mucedo TaxID=29922 RepID=UPI002220E612|nr:uncharacterized protein EV154DRAFT_603040 [Mucor mucedo]KAI7890676.1 hypothetical protein EV154DRAFT_603040 [Mucor mucedo]
MTQSTTMFPFNSTSESSLLERRQISQPFLQQLELPSLPPLSQIMTDTNGLGKKAQVEAVAVTMAAMEAAATASLITSTAQPLMQTDTPFLPLASSNHNTNTYHTTSTTTNASTTDNTTTLTTGDTPVNTILPIYSNNANDPTLFMDPLQQQQQMFNAAAAVAAGLTNNHDLLSMPPSFMDSRRPQRESSVSSTSSDNKVYSFVAIPGTNQRKRPRRRYDEIERLYHCSWTGCTKAYGTLNHLNAHVSMQQHGPKRHPTEFKEMRKEWRRQKKERDTAKKQVETAYRNQQQQMMQTYPSFHPIPTGYNYYQ